MSQKPLEVLIKKGVDTAEITKTPTTMEDIPQRKGQTSTTKKAAQAHLIQVAKSSLNLAISKTGDLTGEYNFARVTSNALSIAGVVGTFAATGPILGSILVGGQALLSVGTTGIDNYVEIRDLEYNNLRLGRISKLGK